MKRFTETEKWRDSWFQGLSPDSKLAFWYITETCDGAGVWDPNEKMAEFSIGKKIDWEKVYREFGSKMRRLPCGKLYLVNFVVFQYGELTETCKPHLKVMKLLQQHGISKGMDTLSLPLAKGMDTLKEEDKEEEEAKDRIGGFGKNIPPSPEEVAEYSVQIGYPMDGSQWCDCYAQKGWMVGKSKMKDWRAAVRTWKANRWLPRKASSDGQLEARFEGAF